MNAPIFCTLPRGRFPAANQFRWLAAGLLLFLAGQPSMRGEDAHPAQHGQAVAATPPTKSSTTPPAPAHGGTAAELEKHGVSPSIATKQDALTSTNLLAAPRSILPAKKVEDYQQQIDSARQLRREKNTELAGKILTGLLENAAMPAEFRRPALFELALVAQEENKLSRAQQILAQYLQLYPEDPSAPEVLLRQGLIYRQMGVNNLAIAKYYGVMSTALKLKLDQFDYYKRLVLQAQTEIADTYYLQGKYAEAADFFRRLLKQDALELNTAQIQFKFIRALAYLGQNAEAVAHSESFTEKNPDAPELAEVRFLHASALKQMGRNREAMRQVLALLDAQQSAASRNPQNWVYWRQRAGNDIANQMYKEGDYVNALEIYLGLAELDPSPAWQWPVRYQIGLVYEHLQQPQKAVEIFAAILDREKELTGSSDTPALRAVLEMAKWRQEHIAWKSKTELLSQNFKRLLPYSTNLSPATP